MYTTSRWKRICVTRYTIFYLFYKTNFGDFVLYHCYHLYNLFIFILEDGGVYVTNLAKEQWKVKGLSIEVLEPYRRMRIIFNGLLRNVAMKNREQVEHVQFHFM